MPLKDFDLKESGGESDYKNSQIALNSQIHKVGNLMGLQWCWSDLTSNCWPRPSRSKPQHNGSNQSTSEPPSLLLAARLQLDITEGRKRSVLSLQRGLGRWPSVASRPDLNLSVSWSLPRPPQALQPDWRPLPAVALIRLRVSGMDFPSQSRCSSCGITTISPQ